MNRIKNKYLIVMIAVIVLIAAAATALVILKNAELSDDAVVANIAGESVSVREFKTLLNYKYNASIYYYFKKHYGVEPTPEFWTTPINGETPAEYARKKTLQEEVGLKIQLLLMKENGILTDISYKGFLKALKKENERRREAVLKKEVIYGPVKYKESEYFEYYFNTNVEVLKKKIAPAKFSISEDELKKRYEDGKEKYFKLPDYIKLVIISIPYGGNPEEKRNAQDRIKAAKNELNSGGSFEMLAKMYNSEGKVIEQVLDENSAKHDSDLLKQEAYKLEQGQISGIIDNEKGFVILKCIERQQNRYKDFDLAKEKIKSDYINEKYDEMLRNLINKVKVEINSPVYYKITP